MAKVIDFGVAKAVSQPLTEKTMFTGYGQIIGTLEYMSPEQARVNQLDVDTRSDIYSLGVLLYELLTGTTPLDKQRLRSAAWDEMLRLIREEEPPKPSTRLSESQNSLPSISALRQTEPAKLTNLVRGELDWIVMKALEKDRNRRYETAASLSDDVRRYLNHEPVAAAPPTVRYRLRKFVRRHRVPMLTISLVFTALVIGAIGATWGLFEARSQAQRAQAEVREKERAFELADAERRRAVEFRDKALDALRATTGGDVELLLGQRQTLGHNERLYLEAIARRWQKFAQTEGADEPSRDVRGEGRYRLGLLWKKLGRLEAARAEYEQAIANREALATEFPDVAKYRIDLAACHINLGSLLADLGEVATAEKHYRQGLAIHESLVDANPTDLPRRLELAMGHNNLALLFAESNRHVEAEEQYRQALDIIETIVAETPKSTVHLHDLARCRNNFGLMLVKLGRQAEAAEQYGQSLANFRRLLAEDPTSPQFRNGLAWTHQLQGNLLAAEGHAEAASDHLRQAITILEKLAVEFPVAPEYRRDLASGLNDLAAVLANLEKFDEAQSHYERAVAIQRELVSGFAATPAFRVELARTHNNLGVLLTNSRRHEPAVEQYRAAVEIQKKLVDEFAASAKYRQELARSCNNLGATFDALHKTAESEPLYHQAIELQERLVADSPDVLAYHTELAGSYCNLGNALASRGRALDSLPWYDKALQELTTVVSANPRDAVANRFLRNAHRGRAEAFVILGRPADSLPDWTRVIELSPPSHRAPRRAARAVALMQAGRIGESVAEVSDLTRSRDWSADAWYNFACVFSVASRSIADKRQEYADQAMEFLRLAVQTGWRDAAQLKLDADLEPLRERTDFQQLLKSLEAPPATSDSRPFRPPSS